MATATDVVANVASLGEDSQTTYGYGYGYGW